MLSGMRGSEWLIILVVVLLLFGARKLPELARSLGASAKEFRKGIADGSADDTQTDTESDQSNAAKD
jgi:sec-independent protein translocase protein TatA